MLTINDDKEAHAFYSEALNCLKASEIPFMLGGAFCIFHHTGVFRDTKDLDVYCKSVDCPRILKFFADKGFRIEFTDARWLAKVFYGDYFIDIIFDTVNNICVVDDTWFQRAAEAEFFGVNVKLLSAEELLWTKIYVQNRERYDGADINHLILQQGKKMDWKHVLYRLDPHWQILLAQILQFQFVYPVDHYDIIPKWLFDELIKRANELYDLPVPIEKVCRGPMIDQTQYAIDIKEWNYKSYTIKTV
jgi:hypothetical protein